MSSDKPILVTGATGNVGFPLVSGLVAMGETVVTAGLNDDGAGTGARRLDFEDATTFPDALRDIGRVFLMRPPQISDTKKFFRPFINAMSDAGVDHVTFLSLMGVNRAMPHWRIEQDLRASTLPWTFLRPSFFAQNLGGAYRSEIREHDRIRVASGRGRTSFVDTRDVAAVAAQVLSDPLPHRGEAYTLTGPRALDYHEVTSLLSAALGRPINYEPIGFLTYRTELRDQRLPGAFVNVQLLINAIARLGLAARIDDTLPRLLGRSATDLETYISDHVSLWTKDRTTGRSERT